MSASSPVVIVFDFSSKTITPVRGDSPGARALAQAAAQQHEMHAASAKPA
jgi:hypothetical protein